MPPPIVNQVVDFSSGLFQRIFSTTFQPTIDDPLRRRAVLRQVDEAADAASQSLTRFFLNHQLAEQHVANILEDFATLSDRLQLEDIANPNVTPESVVEAVLTTCRLTTPCLETI